MTAFYNEIDPYAAQWLRNLIDAGHLASGVVDERDMRDLTPDDLLPFVQCHFFAGIGVWGHALRRAGWPDSTPIWTGSCPCQPFSAAGARGGFDDERHLWPAWFHLITQCGPPTILGEQVASKDGLGWLDLVSADLEGAGYAVGASDLCAAGFGGAHIRQRLYFAGMADDEDAGLERYGRLGEFHGSGRRENPGRLRTARSPLDGMGDADVSLEYEGASSGEQPIRLGRNGGDESLDGRLPRQAGRVDDADWLLCRGLTGEPSWRPVEPGTFPLAHGVACRMEQLRAYGNGLDAETATGFVEAVMGCLP